MIQLFPVPLPRFFEELQRLRKEPGECSMEYDQKAWLADFAKAFSSFFTSAEIIQPRLDSQMTDACAEAPADG